MKRHSLRALALLMLIAGSADAQVLAPGARHPSTKDDAEFMQGMIGHHAQALVMARQAESHGASPSVKVLCARIILAQSTEIRLMQRWLAARNFEVPDSTGRMASAHEHEGMPGMTHADTGVHAMPGMLTAEQMKLLDEARGPTWDRLFLTFMIQHHAGAIAMVDKLFATPGGGQDDEIFKYASDVYADQSTEIERMKSMLSGGR